MPEVSPFEEYERKKEKSALETFTEREVQMMSYVIKYIEKAGFEATKAEIEWLNRIFQKVKMKPQNKRSNGAISPLFNTLKHYAEVVWISFQVLLVIGLALTLGSIFIHFLYKIISLVF